MKITKSIYVTIEVDGKYCKSQGCDFLDYVKEHYYCRLFGALFTQQTGVPIRCNECIEKFGNGKEYV